MSSDETETEATEIYNVKRRDWRSKTLVNYLRIVDADYNKINGYGNPRPGNRPRKRRRPGNVKISLRKAVPGLPRNFYDDTWYETLSNRQKHHLAPMDPVEMLVIGRDLGAMTEK